MFKIFQAGRAAPYVVHVRTVNAQRAMRQCRPNFYRNSFEFNEAYQWNSLPTHLKSIFSYTAFRKALHKHVYTSI